VAIPSRKGEYFIREPGHEALRRPATELAQAMGYGADFPEPAYPDAAEFANLLEALRWTLPEALVPRYLMEPSISAPKKPFAQAEIRG
jgi:hypothetical protein